MYLIRLKKIHMLELNIVDGLRPDLLVAKAKVFNVQGGVIGRDPACDWVLLDRQKIISGRHGKIVYSQGNYFLSDISTNGIFDQIGVAFTKGELRRLNQGDVFVIGTYRIAVVSIKMVQECVAQHQDLEGLFDLDGQAPVLTPLQYAQKSEVDSFADFNFEVPSQSLKAYDFMPEPLDLILNVKAADVAPEVSICERTAFVEGGSTGPLQVDNFPVSVEVLGAASGVYPLNQEVRRSPTEFLMRFFEAFGLDSHLFAGLSQEVLQEKLVTLMQELLRFSLDMRALLQSFQKIFKIQNEVLLEQHNPFLVAVNGRQLFELLLRQDSEFMDILVAMSDFKKQLQSLKKFLEVLPLTQQQLLAQLDPSHFIKSSHRFSWLSEKQAWSLFQQYYQSLTQHDAEAWLQQLRQLVREKI